MTLIQAAKRFISKRTSSYAPDDDYWYTPIISPVIAGVDVNEELALSFSAVYACIKILADTIASLPLHLYKRLPSGGREKVATSNITRLLTFAPNEEMTAFRWKNTCQGHLCSWGNAYNYLDRDVTGRVRGIWPLNPSLMRVIRNKKTRALAYEYKVKAGPRIILTPKECWHIAGFGYDGLKGYSPIELHKQSIGMGMAAEEFGARFYGDGTHPSLVISHPGKLKTETQAQLKDSLQKGYSGLGKSHRLMLLEEGMKPERITVSPEAAQYVQTMKFNVEQVARIYRVPPHMIAALDRATFSNIEHQGLDFVIHTIRPWLVLWEQEINKRFLTVGQSKSQYFEFSVEGLLRGDIKSRYEAYSIAVNNGFMNRNEVRELENQNPMGEQGDVYTVQLALVNLERLTEEPEPVVPQETEEEEIPEGLEPEESKEEKAWGLWLERREKRSVAKRMAFKEAYYDIFRDAANRLVVREAKAVIGALRKTTKDVEYRDKLKAWIDEYYSHMDAYIRDQLYPVFRAYAAEIYGTASDEVGLDPAITPEFEMFVSEYLDRYIQRHIDTSTGQLHSLETPDEIEARVTEWMDKRPDKIARNETVRLGNAMAQVVFYSAGLGCVWTALGESCPYCKELNGMKIQAGQSFVQGGEDWEPAGADNGPMAIFTSKAHPPLHEGCDCTITPG